MASAAQAKAFIDTVAPIAVKVCKERGYGNAQAWTCVAQACCESAFGTSKIMANANAFFGIKANKSWIQTARYTMRRRRSAMMARLMYQSMIASEPTITWKNRSEITLI